MIVISDTSPLNYLALIGAADLLHTLFGEVIIPPAVAAELQADRTPVPVRQFMLGAPAWLTIRSPSSTDFTLPPRLGAGEREAISLAAELHADVLLCDDEKARKSATERNIRVLGTLGIVQLAAAKRLIDFTTCINALKKTTLRLPKELVAEMLEEAKKNKFVAEGQ